MYIPAVPYTAMNKAYVDRQKERFLSRNRPPDFPQGSEANFVGVATVDDITSSIGRVAMGFEPDVVQFSV